MRTSSISQPRKPLYSPSSVLKTKRSLAVGAPARAEISIGSCHSQAGARLKPRLENGRGKRLMSPDSGSESGFRRARSFQVLPLSRLYSTIIRSKPLSLGFSDSISHQVRKDSASGAASLVKSIVGDTNTPPFSRSEVPPLNSEPPSVDSKVPRKLPVPTLSPPAWPYQQAPPSKGSGIFPSLLSSGASCTRLPV